MSLDQGTSAYDRIIIDDPDAPSSQSLTLDEETDVPHLLIESERHKMALDNVRTSCGLEWHAGRTPFVAIGTWKDEPRLCGVCFPPYEQAIAAAHQAEEKRRSSEFLPIDVREWLDSPNGGTRRKK